MFDAKKLLDALVGASARPGMPPDQPQRQGGTPDLGSQVNQAVGRLTGQSTDQLLQKAKATLKFAEVQSDINVAKISVIGVGMRSHAGVALKMFETLAG